MTIHAVALPPIEAQMKIRRFIRRMALTLALIASIGLMSLALSPWYRLGINGTDSLPGVLYLVVKNEVPERHGNLVAFYPPTNDFYPSSMFFIKKAMGLPGDKVTREGRAFYINGEYQAIAKTHSRSGVPLQSGPAGIIPDGQYFVWTPHPDSYDSRYEDIGWITKDRIIGRAVRLF